MTGRRPVLRTLLAPSRNGHSQSPASIESDTVAPMSTCCAPIIGALRNLDQRIKSLWIFSTRGSRPFLEYRRAVRAARNDSSWPIAAGRG